MNETSWTALARLCGSIALSGLLAASSACSSAKACTGDGHETAEVSLRDAVSGSPICEGSVRFVGQDTDMTVSCSQDAEANHEWCSSHCSYFLYGEPSRQYTAEASAAGYAGASTTVQASSDDCGKQVTQHVTLELQPN